MRRARAAAALSAALALAAVLFAGGAGAGSMNGVGLHRTATLLDPSGNATLVVEVPETVDGAVQTTLRVTGTVTGPVTASLFKVALVVSPDDPELRAEWSTTLEAAVASNGSVGTITVPAEALPYRLSNVPFALELQDGDGTVLDMVEFSMDLTYHPPPPDGGLFQLAGGTIAAWGLVLLYAVSLNRAHKRLLARADSLERALTPSGKEGEK